MSYLNVETPISLHTEKRLIKAELSAQLEQRMERTQKAADQYEMTG